jgi:F-type H+-transporting ATPase subunit b
MSEAHPPAAGEHPVEPGQPAEHPEAVATVEHGSAAEHHETPTALGFLTAPMAISLAMVVVILLMMWKKVPAAIGRALDAKIALIRDQLAEAEALRTEAEALKAEYQAKAGSAEAEAAALLERARHEADEIVAKAKTDAEALVARRGRMAKDKIAAEELAAVKQLRASAADASVRAAARLIAERLDAKADEQIVDRAIEEIARR